MKGLRVYHYILALLVGMATSTQASRSFQIRPTEPDIEESILRSLKDSITHKDIVTTVFWIGEKAAPKSGWSDNMDSAWDMRWKENFGGLDSPIFRNGFFPAKFRPKQNPFYIALPFNDISNPEFLDSCPTLQYFKAEKSNRRVRSVCKNRWIEITVNGKTCYGQWQDVGPFYTDDFEYVFSGKEPRAHTKEMAGLDVSPAIRDFLDLKKTPRTNWRFVDEASVPEGPWKQIVTRS